LPSHVTDGEYNAPHHTVPGEGVQKDVEKGTFVDDSEDFRYIRNNGAQPCTQTAGENNGVYVAQDQSAK
jgi:hypothetical protein